MVLAPQLPGKVLVYFISADAVEFPERVDDCVDPLSSRLDLFCGNDSQRFMSVFGFIVASHSVLAGIALPDWNGI